MTSQGAHKRACSLDCALCPVPAGEASTKRRRCQEASRLELEADCAIRDVAPECLVITQARTIKGFSGGVDFTLQLPDGLQIDVEVDGEQHFSKDYRSTSLEEQWARDRAKDELSLQQGRRRVHLHHNDELGWRPRLRGALELARRHPGASFTLFTHSYRHVKEVVELGGGQGRCPPPACLARDAGGCPEV